MLVGVYEIQVFDEAFFPFNIRMTMVTKLVRMVTYSKELPPINLHGPSMGSPQCDKYNTYLHLQKIHGRQTKEGADLLQEAPTLKVT